MTYATQTSSNTQEKEKEAHLICLKARTPPKKRRHRTVIQKSQATKPVSAQDSISGKATVAQGGRQGVGEGGRGRGSPISRAEAPAEVCPHLNSISGHYGNPRRVPCAHHVAWLLAVGMGMRMGERVWGGDGPIVLEQIRLTCHLPIDTLTRLINKKSPGVLPAWTSMTACRPPDIARERKNASPPLLSLTQQQARRAEKCLRQRGHASSSASSSFPPASQRTASDTEQARAPTRHGVIKDTRAAHRSRPLQSGRKAASGLLPCFHVSEEQPLPVEKSIRTVVGGGAQITPGITRPAWGTPTSTSLSGRQRISPSSLVLNARFRPERFLTRPIHAQETSPELLRFPSCKGVHSDHTGRGMRDDQARAECGEIDELV